jgi:hypothetical protein
MKIVPISFMIASEDLTKLSPEDVESAIKDEILKHVIKTVVPMFDDEGFISMTPSEDEEGFDIEINLMIGSTSEYIDATSVTTTNLLELCMNNGISRKGSAVIITKATQPLIDLVH